MIPMMKVAVFGKEVIDEKQYKGVLSIHVVCFHLTIYVTTLLAEGLYVIYEIASIRIPSNIYGMRGFIANMEGLLPVKAVYKQCIEINDEVQQLKKKGGNLRRICQSLTSGNDRKRHCVVSKDYTAV
ncbi:hypothetical protein EDC94DRAFT_600986 [Helicostylum pulchrum]|nr:hypothetical protein EDC94DRAFT_600986 [Helicostylum pulchrum]